MLLSRHLFQPLNRKHDCFNNSQKLCIMQFRKVYLVGFFPKYCDFNSNVTTNGYQKRKTYRFLAENVMMHVDHFCHNTLSCNAELLFSCNHWHLVVVLDHPVHERFDISPNNPGLACKISEFKYHQFVVSSLPSSVCESGI